MPQQVHHQEDPLHTHNMRLVTSSSRARPSRILCRVMVVRSNISSSFSFASPIAREVHTLPYCRNWASYIYKTQSVSPPRYSAHELKRPQCNHIGQWGLILRLSRAIEICVISLAGTVPLVAWRRRFERDPQGFESTIGVASTFQDL